MRILQFCNYADRVGGAEVYAHALIDALRERDHDVALFGGSTHQEVDQPRLRVIQRPDYDAARLVQDAAARNAFRDFVARFQPDVVHVHNVFSVGLDVLQELGSGGAPVLHTVHDFQLLCPNSWCVRGDGTACPGGAGAQCFRYGCEANYPYEAWEVLLTAFRQRLASRMAAVAVAPSMYLADRLRAHGWPRVEHVPYFVDFDAPDTRDNRHGENLLYVGRLEREKGVATLVEALPLVRARFPRVRLDIVGSGSEEGNLRNRVDRLQLGSVARFVSGVPRSEIPAYHARSDLCVLPSVWSENSPLVAYECLQSGLPMVGSAIGGIPELLDGCGFTFRPGDPRDLADAVIRYLSLPSDTRARISDQCRTRSMGFGRTQHVKRMEELYAQVQDARRDSSVSFLTEMLPVLEQIRRTRPAEPKQQSPMSLIRSVARYLGLPKITKDGRAQ